MAASRLPAKTSGSKVDGMENHLLFLTKAFGPNGPKWMRD